jgi:hypothetical protein
MYLLVFLANSGTYYSGINVLYGMLLTNIKLSDLVGQPYIGTDTYRYSRYGSSCGWIVSIYEK